MKKKIIFISILLLTANISYSASTTISGASSEPSLSAKSPIETIIQFYNFALMISGFLAFSVIVFGGVKYMLGAGNPSAQGDAKEWIQGAIWGLVLLFGAYVILYTINPNLVKLKMPELRPVSVAPEVSTATGTTGGIPSVGGARLSDVKARQILGEAGIRVNSTTKTSLYAIRKQTIDEVLRLKNACGNCEVVVTAGTEVDSHRAGRYSHRNGYKVDLAFRSSLNSYIENNFEFVDRQIHTGYPMYKSPSGAIYTKEGNHWDVLVKP